MKNKKDMKKKNEVITKKKDMKKKSKSRGGNEKSENDRKRDLIILLLLLLLALIFIIWYFLNLTPESEEVVLGTPCVDFVKSVFIEDACNLNNDEVQVTLRRIDADYFIEGFEFGFFPSDSLWKVDGSKCLDVRLKDKRYGSYCDVVDEDQTATYVFHHSLGKQSDVNLFVIRNSLSCESESKEIRESCN